MRSIYGQMPGFGLSIFDLMMQAREKRRGGASAADAIKSIFGDVGDDSILYDAASAGASVYA